MPHNVQLTDSTFSRLQRLAVPLVDTIETVIVKLADYWDEGHTAAHKTDVGVGSEIGIEDEDQLPQKAFNVPLMAAMYELGGRAKSGEATELVGEKLAGLLGPGDHRLRTDGKERWQNAVHFSRLHYKLQGLFKKDSERDVWELSEEGIKYAESLIASRKLGNELDNGLQQDTMPRRFNTKSVPNLRHTKLLSAKVGGQPIRPTWNGLLFDLIRRIPKGRLEKPEEARRLIIVNFVAGEKEDEGYKFIPNLGISVQGQDANDSWKGASHIPQKLGVPVEVEFLWRMKEGAEFPGEMGRLSI